MKRIGLVGAGTMGTGIAQVAAQAGFEVLLYDITAAPLEAALSRMQASLARLVERGRASQDEVEAAQGRVTTTSSLGDLARADFVIEAAPESLALKRELFQQLGEICPPSTLLATNTSSLSVTQIGALSGRPESVVGMHFFNPVPAMRLVEVIAGDGSSEAAIQQTWELAVALGKSPVMVQDTPGFLVNRVARPYPGEAMRLLGERVATVAQIDRIARLACGFRMGPFELMDLVGMDVNFAVNQSVYTQFFGEPRFRPHPLQERMLKAGRLGRKVGAGWYRYKGNEMLDGPMGPEFAKRPAARPHGIRRVSTLGAPDLTELVEQAGYEMVEHLAEADLVLLGSPDLLQGRQFNPEVLLLVEASTHSTTEVAAQVADPERVVGYGGIPSVADRQLVEIAPGLRSSAQAAGAAVQFFQSLGRDTEVVADGPGLVAARLLACLVNEATFALQEGVASTAGIDMAMRLGVNYPLGPLEWGERLGLELVLQVLEGLQRQTGEERYRPAPYLRKLVSAGLEYPR